MPIEVRREEDEKMVMVKVGGKEQKKEIMKKKEKPEKKKVNFRGLDTKKKKNEIEIRRNSEREEERK